MTKGVGGERQTLVCTGKNALGGYGSGIGSRSKQQVHATVEGDWNCGCSHDDAEKGFGSEMVWSTQNRTRGIC